MEMSRQKTWNSSNGLNSEYVINAKLGTLLAPSLADSAKLNGWRSSWEDREKPEKSVTGRNQTIDSVTANAELDQIREFAIAEEIPEPSEDLIADARRVLNWMLDRMPFDYEVDLEDDGGVAIHALHQKIYVCIILSASEPDRCFVNMDDERRISTFTNRDKVCGTFLDGALRDLGRFAR